MALATLLGPLSPRRFFEEHFLRLPLAMPGLAAAFQSLGDWNAVDGILRGDVDCLVVRDGVRSECDRPQSAAAARTLLAEGHTVLMRHAERHSPALGQLASEFQREFAAEVDVHLYATPAGRFGFGWHYDAEDVFILQTEGEKEYELRKNTVNPWPLVETMPRDLRYEREIMPLQKCLLRAGDWLYLPNGYWHRATARTDSVSIAVGVLPPTGVDVFDLLRREVLNSLRWRERLPVMGDAAADDGSERRQRLHLRLAELADDLQALLSSDAFARRVGNEFRLQDGGTT